MALPLEGHIISALTTAKSKKLKKKWNARRYCNSSAALPKGFLLLHNIITKICTRAHWHNYRATLTQLQTYFVHSQNTETLSTLSICRSPFRYFSPKCCLPTPENHHWGARWDTDRHISGNYFVRRSATDSYAAQGNYFQKCGVVIRPLNKWGSCYPETALASIP